MIYKVSVIIPAYNVENYIGETIQSVGNQTASPSDFQVVIVDDGSTDNTLEVIQREIQGMENVRVFSGKNQGTAFTRNRAIRESSGGLIMLLDADDLLEPTTVESMTRFFRENPQLAFAYSRHKRIDKTGEFICDRPGYGFSREKLLHFNFIGHVKVFRKDLFERIRGFKDVYVEDYDFVLRASEVLPDDQIAQNPIYLYKYRIHRDNKSVSGIQKSRNAAARAIQDSLRRKEGINTEVFYIHMTSDKYNYFDWRENEKARS